MKTSVIGYPRIGKLRELKFDIEKYFKHEISASDLQESAAFLRIRNWNSQKENGVDFIPSGDFSFYDNMLDTAVLLNIIPKRYKELNLNKLDEYFAMARGYQGLNGDVKALDMKKWFNTNYHYIVPEINDQTEIKLIGTKPFDEFSEAKELNITTKPVIIGAFTFLKLARYTETKTANDFFDAIVKAYSDLLKKMNIEGAEWIQFDEPALVTDLTKEEIIFFKKLYTAILKSKSSVKVILQTYFGDIRDCYQDTISLDFDGIGLDFVEGAKNFDLVRENGFPKGKLLFAGVVNGKNIWKNNYASTISQIEELKKCASEIVIGTSCSLLHVPYTLKSETKLSDEFKKHLSFAEEKLSELSVLKKITEADKCSNTVFQANSQLFKSQRNGMNLAVKERVSALTDKDFTRVPVFEEREVLQKQSLCLPILPTTTIGSFPQTKDVKANRTKFKQGLITNDEYISFNKKKIADCIALQETIGLDVLVHGEYERNDMVEYFGENLDGYVFTEKAWVQSYGTRCVKPPIIWGDISRSKPITVDYSAYAQSLTEKPVKGMLTGPITILNWSFPREDISLKESALQIALAIREEVLDLESVGIKIIQIDEAALREKLPLRKSDWHCKYLDWAIPAFRLVHNGVKPNTQIHTHMCYSEFRDIIEDIEAMDADIISFEASRSNLDIIDALNACNFKTQVGPGVYDIHSPRIPGKGEIENVLMKMLGKIKPEKLWVNPDCGLKTRGESETVSSLKNLVAAAQSIRSEFSK